jgi:DNA ligase-1
MTGKYPDVASTMQGLVQGDCADPIRSAIIDTEVVAYNWAEGRILPFQTLSSRPRKNVKLEDIKTTACLFPFDLIYLNGKSLVREPLAARRELLWRYLPTLDPPPESKLAGVRFAVRKDITSQEEVEAFLDEAIAEQCEGLMLKTLTSNASYEPSKRSLNWLKLKKDYIDGVGDSVDLVPIGAVYGKGKRSGVFGAYLLAVFNASEGTYQTVCKVGTGLSDEVLQEFTKQLSQFKTESRSRDYDVTDRIEGEVDVWFEPKVVWEVKAADLSVSPVHTAGRDVREDGQGVGLRFPRFLRVREDKGPEDSTSSEQILQMYDEQFNRSKGEQMIGEDDDD